MFFPPASPHLQLRVFCFVSTSTQSVIYKLLFPLYLHFSGRQIATNIHFSGRYCKNYNTFRDEYNTTHNTFRDDKPLQPYTFRDEYHISNCVPPLPRRCRWAISVTAFQADRFSHTLGIPPVETHVRASLHGRAPPEQYQIPICETENFP